jgi:WD40 repeat protein
MSQAATAPSAADVLLECPYKGLTPYTEEDAAFFFGREADTELIIGNLMSSRLTLHYGPSGVGKSSVLRAGVIRQLRDASNRELAERGVRDFVVASFAAWRDDPVAGLAARIRASLTEALGDGAGDSGPPSSLPELFEWTRRQDLELLLILDQFEEYFLYHGQDGGEGSFAVEFPRALNRPDLRVNFLIAIREDALARLDRFEGRVPNLFDNYLRLEHLDREAARAAIEGPIRQYNKLFADRGRPIGIEPDLVEALLDQVTTGRVVIGQAGRGLVEAPEETGAEGRIETPYLQLVMTRLWAETMRAGWDVLRLEVLDRLGGAQRIVRTHLDEAMRALPPGEQDVAARVFHHLVTPSGTKIAHTASDLAEYEDVPEGELTGVLEQLAGGSVRILRPVASPAGAPNQHRYEIFHDVLAAAILDWRNRYVLAKEQAAAERELAERLEEESRKQRQAHELAAAERRRARRAQATAGALALLLILTTVLAFWAVRSSQAASREQRNATSRALLAQAVAQLDVDPAQSIRLSLDALRSHYTAEAEELLRRSIAQSHVREVLRGHTKVANSVAFSPDGRLVVTASDDATARVWEVSTGRLITVLRGHSGPVVTAAFGPDRARPVVVTGGSDGTARVWDAHTGRQLASLGHEPRGVWPMLTQDGRLLLTWSWHGTARVWDWRAHRQLAAFGRGAVVGASISLDGRFVAASTTGRRLRLWEIRTRAERSSEQDDIALRPPIFSPDGKVVVAGDDYQRVLKWNWRAGGALDQLPTDYITNSLFDYRFSPDGRQLVVAGDKHAELHDAKSGELLSYFGEYRDWVQTASFSRDGKMVVAASADGTASVWEPRSTSEFFGIRTAELRGHSGQVVDAAFSPDGRLVATASLDGTARIWRIQDATVLRGEYGRMLDAEFSRDGRYIVTGGSDLTARIWVATTLRPVRVFGPMDNEVDQTTFSRDGRLLVTVELEAQAPRVWSVATGKEAVTLDPTATGLSQHAADISPDGTLVVAGDVDGSVRIWDVRSGHQVRHFPDVDQTGLSSARFSGDGRLVVTGGGDGIGRILDATSGHVVRTLRGHNGIIQSARFSPDGKLVLTASDDRTVRVWDAASGRQLRTLTGAPSGLVDASFSADGRLAISGGADSITLVWEWASGRTLAVLHEHGDFVNSATFSPDGQRILSASDDTTAKLYPCETCGSRNDIIRLGNERDRAVRG